MFVKLKQVGLGVVLVGLMVGGWWWMTKERKTGEDRGKVTQELNKFLEDKEDWERVYLTDFPMPASNLF